MLSTSFLSIAMIAALHIGIAAAMQRSGWPREEQAQVFRVVASVLVGWFALAVVLSWRGAYEGTLARAPTIQYGLFIPIILGVVLLWRSEFAGRLLDIVPQPWIVAVQLYRALGVIFLVQYALSNMPGLFALPAGIGDVAVGPLTGFLTSPSALQMFAFNNPNTMISAFPLALVYLVPLFIILHIASLKKLAQESRGSASAAQVGR